MVRLGPQLISWYVAEGAGFIDNLMEYNPKHFTEGQMRLFKVGMYNMGC